MARKIRTLVAAVAVPLVLFAGIASAGKPGTVAPNIPYDIGFTIGGCEESLVGLESAVKAMYGAEPKGKQVSIIDNLVSKVYGADQKVDQGKPLEAVGLVAQVEDKAFYLMSLPTSKELAISAEAYDVIIAYASSEPTGDGTLKGLAAQCVYQKCLDSGQCTL